MRFGSRAILAVAFGAMAGLAPVMEANAASAVCRQLESQLARAGSGGNMTKVDSTLIRQRQELRKAQAQLRAARCGFFNSSGQCSSIRAVISRMERNVTSLESRSRGGAGGRSRAQIMAAIDANGCRRAPQREMIARNRDRGDGGFLSSFFGASDRRKSQVERPSATEERPWIVREPRRTASVEPPRQTEFRNRNDNERRRDSEEARRGVGAVFAPDSYQAMCVRTSDGYYFPISPSSYRSDLRRDQNNCQAMCPGSEVAIYYKRLDDDEIDNMASASNGKSYKTLPTAYRYRDNRIALGCSGDRNKALLAAAEGETTTVDFQFPVPSPKPGSDNTIPLWIGSPDAAIATPPPEERTVRVVGPAFLPDQQAASGPQVPAPTRAQ